MVTHELKIGRWLVEFDFAPDGYDIDYIIQWLFDCGAPWSAMQDAYDLMEAGKPNRGFTFGNGLEYRALVVIGPTTSGEEFVNTLVHELHHLAVIIAGSLGVELDTEEPAYLAGDTAMELARFICEMGCDHCRG